VITIVVKEPGKRAEARQIEHGLDAMQSVIAIGSFTMLEHVDDGPDGAIDLWANEEGKYASEMVTKDLGDGVTSVTQQYAEANIKLWDGRDFLMGPCFMAGNDDEGETISLTSAQVDTAKSWLDSRSVSIIDAARARAFAEQFR
jgi:hypothetical protein